MTKFGQLIKEKLRIYSF